MTEISPQFVKGLLHQLVKAVGGTDAAGALLGVSHQRVSQLTSMVSSDMPTLMQIVTLERAAEQPIITGQLSDMIKAEVKTHKPLIEEACEVSEAAGNLLRLVREKAPQREIEAAIVAVHRETQDVSASVTRALRAVQ